MPKKSTRPLIIQAEQDPVIRFKHLEAVTGLPRTTAYSFIKKGLMPAPIKLGVRACGWRLSVLRAWMDSRPEAGGAAAQAARELADTQTAPVVA